MKFKMLKTFSNFLSGKLWHPLNQHFDFELILINKIDVLEKCKRSIKRLLISLIKYIKFIYIKHWLKFSGDC